MSTRFPATGVDDATTLPNPSANNKTNNPSHASLHANTNDAVKAVETKLGTGSSTPANNTFFIGNGAGTSTWSAITSAQLAARVSDETGTGAVVFGTSPTLVNPAVDAISESTPANGVTIDSLNLKDGKLNTNDSVITSNITDGAVTPAKLQTGTGTSWAWQSWAPTYTNFSLGNGTLNYAKYIQTGKSVHFKIKATLGSSSSVSGAIVFSLPVNTAADYATDDSILSQGTINDAGTARFPIKAVWVSASTLALRVSGVAATYATSENTSSTVPMTWTTSDYWQLEGEYEVA